LIDHDVGYGGDIKIGAEIWQKPPVAFNYTEFRRVIQSRMAAIAQ
jgi:hypothetical protein